MHVHDVLSRIQQKGRRRMVYVDWMMLLLYKRLKLTDPNSANYDTININLKT